MANPIVTVNVTVTAAPTPSTLQKTGALISQGGTTLTAGTYSLLTQFSDLTALLPAALAITGAVWASSFGGQVTVTAAAVHGVAVGTQFVTTLAGVVPAGYNGTVLATATGTSTFTYYLTTNPGSLTTAGTYTRRNVGEIQAMARTFFGQGAQQSVYVLELGAGEPAAGVTALSDFITASPQFFYAYLVPRAWDGVSSFLSFIASYEATTAKTYFWVTTTLQNYALYTSLMKPVVPLIEAPVYGKWPANVITGATWTDGQVTATTTTAHTVAPGDYFSITGFTPTAYNGTFIALPGTTASTLIYSVPSDPGADTIQGTLVKSLYESDGIPATEFSHAADFRVMLNYNPNITNKLTQFEFSYLFGVTPFPMLGNSAILTTLLAADISYIDTGQEGGISGAMLRGGQTKDGRPFNFWYVVDWMQIQVALAIANAIINGSNNPINPLYYNQQGIDRLEQVAANVGGSSVSFGLSLGQVIQVGYDGTTFAQKLNDGEFAGQLVINAVPFVPYTKANPSAYAAGSYDGMSMTFSPQNGFRTILFNINVTDFVSA